MESFSILLMALLFGSGSFFTFERDDYTGHKNETSECVLPIACPMSGYENWYRINSHCVKYYSSPLMFNQAESFCRRAAPGGHLVSVHNPKANGDLLCIVIRFSPQDLRFWIGGFRHSARFHWTDGSPWNFQIWTPGKPRPHPIRRHKNDCVEMNWNHVGKWNDSFCVFKKSYMCAFKIMTA